MTDLFTQRKNALSCAEHSRSLRNVLRGIEKESLRVTPEGLLAQTPHPLALGSALKHPAITTDFSEALLEFITPPCATIKETLDGLAATHAYTYDVLAKQHERLWPASMPCVLGNDNNIPIAQYGTAHAARMKSIYRTGLGNRYGRAMQTIAGIHYNISFPDDLWETLKKSDGFTGDLQTFKTQRYFDVIRNFRRYLWLLLYLFGASPAVCATFAKNKRHNLQAFDTEERSLFLPHATSLRMGGLGYQSDAQSALTVCYNGLPSYISTLKSGLTHPYPAYEKIGLRDADGKYRQLSTNLLQIENEFYSTIRPKRVTRSGETPIFALFERGVEYIEVRSMDINPYLPLGIDTETAHFLEVFLLWCLLSDSPPADMNEYRRIARNQLLTIEQGRKPSLLLERAEGSCALTTWGLSLIGNLQECAVLLDNAQGGSAFQDSVNAQTPKLEDSNKTPSAQVLCDMADQGLSFFEFGQQQAQKQQQWFAQQKLSAEQRRNFEQSATESLAKQEAQEVLPAAISFEQYLQCYYAQYDRV